MIKTPGRRISAAAPSAAVQLERWRRSLPWPLDSPSPSRAKFSCRNGLQWLTKCKVAAISSRANAVGRLDTEPAIVERGIDYDHLRDGSEPNAYILSVCPGRNQAMAQTRSPPSKLPATIKNC